MGVTCSTNQNEEKCQSEILNRLEDVVVGGFH